jgi:hypothetical protein
VAAGVKGMQVAKAAGLPSAAEVDLVFVGSAEIGLLLEFQNL